MDKKHNSDVAGAGHVEKKPNAMAVLAYLWALIIIPFLTDAKNEPFVKFHLKQGLTLIVLEVVGMFVGWVPVLGWIAGFIIWVASFVFIIIGIMNVVNGREKELPIIGKYANNFKF